MLTSIHIRDFQGIDRLHLQFGKGVNVIVGPSDSCKSAVIRALQWACFNRPRGDSIIKDGTDYAGVTLQADGYKISRRRGVENWFSLQQRGEEKVVYKAIGSDVPNAIADLLNVGPVNFQGQHDGPFWFSLAPGQVSKELNAVVDLSVIDSTLRHLALKLRRAKSEVTTTEGHVSRAKATTLEFDDVPTMNEDLEDVETLFLQYEHTASERRSLRELANRVSTYRVTLKKLKERRTAARILLKLGDRAKKAGDRVVSLESLADQLLDDDWSTPIDFTPLQVAKVQYALAEKKLTRLVVLEHKLAQATARQKQAAGMSKSALEMIEKQCEGVCPLCEQSLPLA
jgi:chromosome segregation ATPase